MKHRKLLYSLLFTLLLAVVGTATAQPEERPFIGIGYAEAEDGVIVNQILPDSPAESAGLQVGDIITAVDGESVSADNFAAVVTANAVGDEIVLTITRDGEEQELTVTLASAPETLPMPGGMPRGRQERPFLGVRLEDNEDALTIAEVSPDSPAAEAGLEAGDVITELNGEDVTTAEAFVQSIQALETGAEVVLTIQRGAEAGEETLEITAALGSTFEGRGGGRDGGRGSRIRPFGRGEREILILPGQFSYLSEESAWEVGELAKDSPFYEAGLRTGDTITAINGETYDSDNLLQLFAERIGENVTLTVQRGDETETPETETLEIEVDSTILPSLYLAAQGLQRMPRGGNFKFPDGFDLEGFSFSRTFA